MAHDFMQPGGRDEGGASIVVGMEGVDESLRILTRAGADLHGLETGRVYQANAFLRSEARGLADWLASTTVAPLVRRGPAPQSAKMADTIRTKADRMPVIRLGAVNPKLSGWRPGQAGNRRWRGSLAWGIERGPASPVNRYRVSRNTRGWILGPSMDVIGRRAAPRYGQIVYAALEFAGVTSWRRAV